MDYASETSSVARLAMLFRNCSFAAVIGTLALVCGLDAARATPLDHQVESNNAICRDVDLKTAARDYLGVTDSETKVLLLTNPGFDEKILRRETLAGFTYFVAPLEKISLCAGASDQGKSSLRKVLFTEGDMRFTAAKVFSERIKTQDDQGERPPTIVRIEVDDGERRVMEQTDGVRSRADLVQLGIESSVRHKYLEEHQLRFTAENLIQAAAIPTRYFDLKVIYTGFLSPNVGKDIISEIAIRSGVPATEIALIGDPESCQGEQKFVMYFDVAQYGRKNLIFVSAPGLEALCTFSSLSTALSAASMRSLNDFDSATTSDTFFVIDLIKKSLSRMHIADVAVEPAGPIDAKEAYVTITGLRDQVNMPGIFTGKRNERVFLKLTLKDNLLSIDQRYEYSNFSGSLRWRDPEDPQYASSDFAKGASLFLGRLISEIKYLLTTSK